MKRYYLILILVCGYFNLHAQFIQDISGKPVLTQKYTNIKGSPYLYPDWQKGTVKLSNGKVYKDVNLMLDLVSDEVFFKSPTGDDMLSFVDDVTEFTITDGQKTMYFNKGFNPVDEFTKNTFYQVLQKGTIGLLKKTRKVILETKAYNSASTDQQFDEQQYYYLLINDKLLRTKKDKKAILSALPAKKNEVEAYINKEKLKLKTDEDLTAVIKFYNEL